MLRSGCISRMATVPTNRTNARAEETVYTNRGTNAHTCASIYPKTYERSSDERRSTASLPVLYRPGQEIDREEVVACSSQNSRSCPPKFRRQSELRVGQSLSDFRSKILSHSGLRLCMAFAT